jgi:hypothetical protein
MLHELDKRMEKQGLRYPARAGQMTLAFTLNQMMKLAKLVTVFICF